MSYHVIENRSFIVDHKIAAAHLAMTPVVVDCKVKPKKLADLREHILAGTFHSCEWGIITCKEDGSTERVNGKHTALLFSDPTLQYGDIKITCTYWECDTRREKALIFATYDRKINIRSLSDNNKAVAADVPSLDKAAGATIDKCVSGIASAKYGPVYHMHRTADQRAQELHQYNDYCAFVRENFESKEVDRSTREKFRQYSVFAAMWLHFHEDEKAARIFWGLVFRGDGKVVSKARKLNTHIITKPLSVLKGASSNERSETRVQTCLHLYDSWWKEYSKSYTTTKRRKILSKRKQLRDARITVVAKKNV